MKRVCFGILECLLHTGVVVDGVIGKDIMNACNCSSVGGRHNIIEQQKDQPYQH